MKITRIVLYPLPNRFKGGPYVTSYGPRPTLNNLFCVVETDGGPTGYGEICRFNLNAEDPLSDAYLGDLAGILAPVVGLDPRSGAPLLDALGPLARERVPIKAGIDGACLDIAAKAAGLPLHDLLGGRRCERVPHYFSIGRAEPDAMAARAREVAAQGFTRFQVKIGEGVDADAPRIQAVLDAVGPGHRLMADANGGLSLDQAAATVEAVKDDRLLWEEPCKTYEENEQLAKATGAPIVLDQCLLDVTVYARACVSGLFAGCGLKPALQGGVSQARLARDLCVAHGVQLKMDDNWALEPATVASLHLALGTPETLILGALDQWTYFETNLTQDPSADSLPWFEPFPGPGLGFTLRDGAVGEPVLEVGE